MLTVASRAALAGLWALGLAAGPVLAAQPEPQSHAVVEALPDPNDPNHLLNAALIRLGQSPRDSEALISAGNAALALGDADAARGFLTRADRLSPGNPRVQAGLAGAMLRGNDPVAAIPLYEAADRGGALDGDRISDRGLAYDLVGDNLTAQRYYRQALAMGANDETVRRLGLSLAIAGDRRGMEVTLSPLLQKQDRASWRVRAFAFAILGREEEAVAIAKATMPGDLATGISPYLRYMRKLTPAQQAAAANFGKFPNASAIGQDDPRIAAYAGEHGLHRLALAAVDTPLVPVGEALGAKDRKRQKGRGKPAADERAGGEAENRGAGAGEGAAAALAPPEPMPSRIAQPVVEPHLAEARERKPVVPPRAPVPVPLPVASVQWEAVPVKSAPARIPVKPVAPVRVMGPTLAEAEADSKPLPVSRPEAAPVPVPVALPVVAAPVAAPVPAPVPAPVAPVPAAPPRPVKRDFAQAFGALGTAKVDTAPVSGAVDLRKIAAPRPAPKAPPPPAHPSRIWVQLEVGRDSDRLAFDWRRMKREEPELLRGKKPSTTEWVRTNRLLVGPFETEAAAKAYNEKLRKAGHDGTYMWISPTGQAVDALDGD